MKRRVLALLLVLSMVMVWVPNSVFAAETASGTCGENLTWTLEDGVLTISGTGEMEDYGFIKEDGIGTTRPTWGYYISRYIVEVVIKDGVTSIGSDAFYECTNLTNITIPDSVTSIGRQAFYSCYNLNSITIPDSVTSIGEIAFMNCIRMTSITIPDSVTNIGRRAFEGCTSLTSITIPGSVTSIGAWAFDRCTSLTSITIPSSVTSIGAYTFSGCTSLTSVTISGSVTEIGFRAFADCSNLADVYYGGTEKQWAEIELGYYNECLTNATIHYNCDTSSSERSDTMIDGSVCFFREWDAEKQVAYFNTDTFLGSRVTEETDLSFLDDVDNLVGQYVLVKTKAREDNNVDSDTLLSIKPVETQTGTVTDAGDGKIVIDGTTFTTTVDAFLCDLLMDTFVVYHLYDGQVVGIDGLYAKRGTLKSWNAKTQTLDIMDASLISTTYTLSNLASDETNEAVANCVGKDVYYCADSCKVVYRLSENKDNEWSLVDEWSLSDEWSFRNYGVEEIPLTDEDYETLTKNMDNSLKEFIDILIDQTGENGQCYGLAATSLMVKLNSLSLDRIQNGLECLYDAQKTASAKSVIGYYSLNQYTGTAQATAEDFMSLPLKTQLKIISNSTIWNPCMLSFGCDGWGAHAVVAYSHDTGTWTYHGHTYDTCILTYDSNYPGTNKNKENAYLYFNSNTYEWEIPVYYNYGISSDADGYFKRACFDVSVLQSLDYENNSIWVRNTSDVSILANENTYDVLGEKSSVENEISVFYDVGYCIESQEEPVLNTKLYEVSDCTIIPKGEDCLDISVLYPDYCLSIESDSYDSLLLKEEGAFYATGLQGGYTFEMTADDDCTVLPWYTIEVIGTEGTEISAKITDSGMIISGDDLTDVTVMASNDEETVTLVVSLDEESMLLAEDGDGDIAVYIDSDNDGEYEIVDTCESATGHSWDEGVITKEPSSTEKGVKTYTCKSCGKTKTEAIAVLTNPFTDLANPSSYYDAVLWAVDRGITKGTSDTEFSPKADCTRAQIVTFLWRYAGEPEPTSTNHNFVDLVEDSSYYKAVLWAVEKGITNGLDDTHFGPKEPCTRAQIVTFLWRAAGKPEPSSQQHSFEDIVEPSSYYNAVLWVVEKGITTGADATHFNPKETCTRAQGMTFLYRYNNTK